MRAARPIAFLLLMVAGAVPADDSETPVGARWESFDNPTGSGSPRLRSLIWYPARPGATRELADGAPEGRSAIVFLHGQGGFALAYTRLGRELARRGFIVVVSDTAWRDPALQRADGRALHEALVRANEERGAFLEGALAVDRIGISGHSMGGGSAAHVLCDNPGYAAGFALAPWQGGRTFSDHADAVDVPFGILHGQGDRTLDWQQTARRLFDALPAGSGRLFYLQDATVGHQNLAIVTPFSSREDQAIFERALDLQAAFFTRHLRGDEEPLARLLDPDAPDERRVEVVLDD